MNRELVHEVDMNGFRTWINSLLNEMEQHSLFRGKRSILLWISLVLTWIGYDQQEEVEDCDA